MKVHIDFETQSFASLKNVGAWKYSEDPTTRILCLSYAIDDKEPDLWTPAQRSAPLDLMQAIHDGAEIHAWNVGFEYAIWHNICLPVFNWARVPFNNWRDTQAKAAAMSYPLALGKAAAALKVGEQKDKRGAFLISKLCKPVKGKLAKFIDSPDLFFEIYHYCKQDVRTERAIDRLLPDLSVQELKVWQHCLKMNVRGLPMEGLELASLVKAVEEEKERYNRAIVVLTKGDIKSANQTKALKDWMNKEIGKTSRSARMFPPVNSVAKNALKEVIENPDTPRRVKQVAKYRLLGAHSSVAKLKKAMNMLCKDDTIKDLLAYHGANTGRYAGRNFQLQNLPRGEVKIVDPDTDIEIFKTGDMELIRLCLDVIPTAATLIRNLIKAPKGKKLIAADYSSIEAVATPWVAGEAEVLKAIRAGLDLYKKIAAKMFNISYHFVKKSERQAGKICVLAAGFAGGKGALLGMAENYGIEMTDNEAQEYITRFRQSRPELPRCWKSFERAARQALENRDPSNNVIRVQLPSSVVILFRRVGRNMFMRLPSGRDICYPNARLEYVETPWGSKQISVVYDTIVGSKWTSRSMTGGNFFQNAIQGICRDLLCEAQLKLEDAGYPIYISVHDECGSFVPDDPRYNLAEFISIMTDKPTWAKGLPVSADGFEAKRYKK